MKIFFNVIDRPYNSFLVIDPVLIDIYDPNGILSILIRDSQFVYVNWNIKECLDAMSLIMDHQRITFDVHDSDFQFDEPIFY